MNRRFWAVAVSVLATGVTGCNPGYMKASELEAKHQGPSDCAARCAELGMRMGAFVLVSDTLPGCVCQPKPPAAEPAKPSPSEAPAPDAAQLGVSAAPLEPVVVMAAAAAVRTIHAQQKTKKEQSYLPN